MSEFLKKLQSQPEYIRKIILWTIVLAVGAGLFFLWIKFAQKKFQEFPGEKLKEQFQPSPALEEQLKDLSDFEMPSVDEQTLKEIEELLRTATGTDTGTTTK